MSKAVITVTPEGYARIQSEKAKIKAKVVRLIGRDAQRYAPRDTNELHDSIDIRPALGRVYVTARHWAAQEYGARPHPIPNAFGRGFTVQHPGNAAQPYMRPALFTKRGSQL